MKYQVFITLFFILMYYIIRDRVSITLIYCINNDFPSSIHLLIVFMI